MDFGGGRMAVQQGSLIIRFRSGAGAKTYCDAQWRYREESGQRWRLKKQRLGMAWMEPDSQGGWRKRKGRCPKGFLDERAATVAAVNAMDEHARMLERAEQARREAAEHKTTVRELAHSWLDWLEQV